MATGLSIHLSKQPAFAPHWADDIALPAELPGYTSIKPQFCINSLCLKVHLLADSIPAALCPECGGQLADCSLAESQILPKDTKMWKMLYQQGERGHYFTSLVIEGVTKDSIHRPEICLVAQGYQIINERVEPIDLPDGHRLKIKLLEIMAPDTDGHGRGLTTSLFAYWLFQHDRETPYHVQRMIASVQEGILHNTWTSWAYISIHTPASRDSERLILDLKAFVRKLYPRVIASAEPPREPPAHVDRLTP